MAVPSPRIAKRLAADFGAAAPRMLRRTGGIFWTAPAWPTTPGTVWSTGSLARTLPRSFALL